MSNVNAATVKAIRTNIINIIKNTLKWDFEDGSVNTEAEENYWTQLETLAPRPGFNHGEGDMHITQAFELKVIRKVDGKTDHQEKAIDVAWELEENITEATLNIGDLLNSKLITLAEVNCRINEPDNVELIIFADITVTLRDLRT